MRMILVLFFFLLQAHDNALAVGSYVPPCEDSQTAQENSIDEAKKCLRKNAIAKVGSLSTPDDLCIVELKAFAKNYRDWKICEREASLFGRSSKK